MQRSILVIAKSYAIAEVVDLRFVMVYVFWFFFSNTVLFLKNAKKLWNRFIKFSVNSAILEIAQNCNAYNSSKNIYVSNIYLSEQLDILFNIYLPEQVLFNRHTTKRSTTIATKTKLMKRFISNSIIVTVCVFVRHLFSWYPFYFDFHSARIIFDVSSVFYLWNINKTTEWHL